MTIENKHILTGHVVGFIIVFGWPVMFYVTFITLNLDILSNPAAQVLTHVVSGLETLACLALAAWTVRSSRRFSKLGKVLSTLSMLILFTVILLVHLGLIGLLKW